MYLKKLELTHIKSFERFAWELPPDAPAAGWHVLLGDNGSGKSSLLRACAVALLGAKEALALRLNWTEWVTRGESEGEIALTLASDAKWDYWTGKGNTSAEDLKAGIRIGANDTLEPIDHRPSADRHAWGGGKGWFSASFGPFRRFTGGNVEYEKLFYSKPRLARHLSIFGEDVALTETLAWLKQLRFEQLEKGSGVKSGNDDLLETIRVFLNQPGFLPNRTQLVEVNSKEIIFQDGNGHKVAIESLSDGFRSILSLTLELIRQLAEVFGGENIFSSDRTQLIPPGLVLVDEIDVHLHPRWQRVIGPWLTAHFPNTQFLVTTHSPLVCQGAERGSVTRLPQPGGDDPGGPITGAPLKRLLYGDILEALSSGAFGTEVGRSDKGREMLEQLARLNSKAWRQDLSPSERSSRRELQEIFGAEGSLMEVGDAEGSRG